jgi:hypothetical protein
MSVYTSFGGVESCGAVEVAIHSCDGVELLGQKTSTASLPIVIASDQSDIPTRSLISNRVIWNTDSAWNKGILGIDIEIFGTGNAAVIRPNTESLPGLDIYLTYHLNETSGVNVTDSSGNSRNGVIVNPEPYSLPVFVSGKLNNALSWPGENEAGSYINCGNITNFEYNQPFSIDCWIYKAAGYEFLSIVDKYDPATTKGWIVQIQDGYPCFFLFGDSATNFIQIYGATQIPDTTYTHLVITYDGLGLASGVNFYINGVLTGTSIYWDSLNSTSILNTANLNIGASPNRGQGFIGQIDEFNIYTKVLSQTDVDFRYNSGTGTETPFELTTRYKTSGHYETNIFDSQFLNQNWGTLQIGASTPTGTTLTIKARTSNDKLIMGDYSNPLNIGEETELIGQYIQLSIDFTGTFTERAVVDYIATLYVTPLLNDVTP